MAGKESTTLAEIAKIATIVLQAWETLKSLKRDSLTYRELIAEVTQNNPAADERIKGCAVMKNLKEGKIEITFIYLDAENTPIFKSLDTKTDYGFVISVNKIDQEINDLFKNKNLVIMK